MTPRDNLETLLDQENQAIREFLALLRQEQAVLTSGNAAEMDMLPALTERKDGLARTLESLARRRNAALTERGFADERNSVEAWLSHATDNAQSRTCWANTLALASEAREINRQNGELINIRMQHNSRALETLQGAQRGLDLYGPNGQYAPPGQGRIKDAV